MIKNKKTWMVVLMIPFSWVGCGTVQDFWKDPHTKHFIHGAKGKDLLLVRIDQAAKEIEEFGTAGMAAPVVALPDERFAFGLEESAKTYYDNARSGVQLGVGRSLENLNSARSGLQVQADIGQILAAQAGLAQFGAALEAASEVASANPEDIEVPEFPTEATAAGTPPAMPEGVLPDLKRLRGIMTNGGNLLPLGDLLPDSFEPTLSDRDAILIAHQSKVVQGLLDFIGNPALKKELDGKVYLFGVTTVSVAPGYRTESGYAASIDSIAGYEWSKTDHKTAAATARSLIADDTLDWGFRSALAREFLNMDLDGSEPSEPGQEARPAAEQAIAKIPASMFYNKNAPSSAPFVLPVTPLIDSQVLDLSMSRRRYQEFAQRLALTAVFASSQVATDGALEFIEALQEDARGKSLNISVSAFSYSGGNFGFEIGPRLEALDVESRRAKKGEVLERQSFPALLLIALDKQDIAPRFAYGSSKRLEMWTPAINLKSVGVWKPLGKRGKRQRDSRRIMRSEEIGRLTKRFSGDKEGKHQQLSEFLKAREAAMAYKRASFANIDIPMSFLVPENVGRPSDVKLVPSKVDKLSKKVSFALTGNQLSALDVSKAVILAKKKDGAVSKFAPSNPKNGAIAELSVDFGDEEFASAEIVVPPTKVGQVFTQPVRLSTEAVTKTEEKSAPPSRVVIDGILEPSSKSLELRLNSDQSIVNSEFALQLSGFFADAEVKGDQRPVRPDPTDKTRTVSIESAESVVLVAGQGQFELAANAIDEFKESGLLRGTLKLTGEQSPVEIRVTLVETTTPEKKEGETTAPAPVVRKFYLHSKKIVVSKTVVSPPNPALDINVDTQD